MEAKANLRVTIAKTIKVVFDELIQYEGSNFDDTTQFFVGQQTGNE